MKKFVCFILIALVGMVSTPSWGTSYYLFNQWGGTWHDANKSFSDDSLMCWAAAASNILDWGRWDTVADSNERQIFGEFKEHWTNNRGWQSWGWQWWLNGGTFNYGYAYVNVAGGGKYWPNNSFYNYYTTASGSTEMTRMADLMNKGYGISLVIGPHTNQHAITCWGYDYILQGTTKLYTALYITDSDDRVTALKKMNIAYSDTNGWYFTSGYTNWNVMGVYGFLRRSGTSKESISWTGSGGLPIAAVATTPIIPSWPLLATGLLLLILLRLRRRQRI